MGKALQIKSKRRRGVRRGLKHRATSERPVSGLLRLGGFLGGPGGLGLPRGLELRGELLGGGAGTRRVEDRGIVRAGGNIERGENDGRRAEPGKAGEFDVGDVRLSRAEEANKGENELAISSD